MLRFLGALIAPEGEGDELEEELPGVQQVRAATKTWRKNYDFDLFKLTPVEKALKSALQHCRNSSK